MFLTKLTRTALLTAFLLLALTSCYLAGPPAKERDFGATDMFLPLDLFPENWQEVGEIRPMGPDSALGFGDTDDAFLGYNIKQAPTNMAYYYVYKNSAEGLAKSWFSKMLESRFSNRRVSISQPWQTPDAISYQSTFADQFHVACAEMELVNKVTVCRIIARYEEFCVDFHSVIRDNTLSLQEFNTIVCHIDAVFVARLGLSKEPIDCDEALTSAFFGAVDWPKRLYLKPTAPPSAG